jgi:hypothetical protein
MNHHEFWRSVEHPRKDGTEMTIVASFVGAARSGLAELADPVKAPEMQAYMKSEMPFRGVLKPARRMLNRRLFAEYPLADRESFTNAVTDALGRSRVPRRKVPRTRPDRAPCLCALARLRTDSAL